MAETHKAKKPIRDSFSVLVILMVGLVLLDTSVTQAAATRNTSSRTLRAMARVYLAYGEYAKAQPLVEQALNVAKENNASESELAMCLIDLSVAYKQQGRLTEAEKACTMGLSLQQKVLYENHPYLAYTLRILSSIYLAEQKYQHADDALKKAMTIMLDSHQENDKGLVPFWVDIAELLVATQRYQEAEYYYNKAIAMLNDSYGPDHLYTSNVLAGIAKLYTLQGKYTQAEQIINRAIANQERIYGPDHHLIASSLLTKARICQALGNSAEAETLIKKALSLVKGTQNTVTLAIMTQQADEIRSASRVTYGPVAKAAR